MFYSMMFISINLFFNIIPSPSLTCPLHRLSHGTQTSFLQLKSPGHFWPLPFGRKEELLDEIDCTKWLLLLKIPQLVEFSSDWSSHSGNPSQSWRTGMHPDPSEHRKKSWGQNRFDPWLQASGSSDRSPQSSSLKKKLSLKFIFLSRKKKLPSLQSIPFPPTIC